MAASSAQAQHPFIYCHGMPGGPSEQASAGRIILAPDRNLLPGTLTNDAAIDAVTALIADTHPTGEIGLIGFSLGAKMALELAARLGRRVSEIHLISSAGPIFSPDMFDQMAGGAIFKLAQRRPSLLPAVAAMQSLLARRAPGLLCRLLFANAQGEDAALAKDAAFLATITRTLHAGLGQSAAAWVREINAYVQPWDDRLWAGSAPVTLWHGTVDNWAPPSMASDLAHRLGARAQVKLLPGLSHYSTLHHALPLIAAD